MVPRLNLIRLNNNLHDYLILGLKLPVRLYLHHWSFLNFQPNVHDVATNLSNTGSFLIFISISNLGTKPTVPLNESHRMTYFQLAHLQFPQHLPYCRQPAVEYPFIVDSKKPLQSSPLLPAFESLF